MATLLDVGKKPGVALRTTQGKHSDIFPTNYWVSKQASEATYATYAAKHLLNASDVHERGCWPTLRSRPEDTRAPASSRFTSYH